jgi:hypothetical protein
VDKAIVLAAEEISRRLDILNHYHELAREKERSFVGREAFDTFVLRVADDFAMFRRESLSLTFVPFQMIPGHSLLHALATTLKTSERPSSSILDGKSSVRALAIA